MKDKIKALKERYIGAKTDKERDAIREEMRILCDEDANTVAETMVEMARKTADRAEELIVRERLKEITPIISMAYISKTYFHKTRAWLNHRINGAVVNGKTAKFTPDEIDTLNYAIQDISRKLSTIHVPIT
jgi:hypothetical protein